MHYYYYYYYYLHEGEYREDNRTTLPQGLGGWCRKELCEDSVYLQKDTDFITHKLRPSLHPAEQHHYKGRLIALLPPDEPVYQERDADGLIIRLVISDVIIKPPSGAWRSRLLSVCSTTDNIIVTEYYEKVVNVFSKSGKNTILCISYIFHVTSLLSFIYYFLLYDKCPDNENS